VLSVRKKYGVIKGSSAAARFTSYPASIMALVIAFAQIHIDCV